MFNKEQQKAIETVEGQVILIACPGSGKTTTLLARIHRMIEIGIDPNTILMVTFTNEKNVLKNNTGTVLSLFVRSILFVWRFYENSATCPRIVSWIPEKYDSSFMNSCFGTRRSQIRNAI